VRPTVGDRRARRQVVPTDETRGNPPWWNRRAEFMGCNLPMRNRHLLTPPKKMTASRVGARTGVRPPTASCKLQPNYAERAHDLVPLVELSEPSPTPVSRRVLQESNLR